MKSSYLRPPALCICIYDRKGTQSLGGKREGRIQPGQPVFGMPGSCSRLNVTCILSRVGLPLGGKGISH